MRCARTPSIVTALATISGDIVGRAGHMAHTPTGIAAKART
jgi:hypothetical protein